jgi:uncharacterized membrane protein HdeD (DUF308 family)
MGFSHEKGVMMGKKSKPRIRSKTYAFGVALAAVGVAVLSLPEFKALIETVPAEYQGVALFVAGILTLVFRELTDAPLGSLFSSNTD